VANYQLLVTRRFLVRLPFRIADGCSRTRLSFRLRTPKSHTPRYSTLCLGKPGRSTGDGHTSFDLWHSCFVLPRIDYSSNRSSMLRGEHRVSGETIVPD